MGMYIKQSSGVNSLTPTKDELLNEIRNRCKNVSRMYAGTVIVKGTGAWRVAFLTNSTINSLLGVSNSTNINTTVTCSNGDLAASAVTMSAVYDNSTKSWLINCSGAISSGVSVRVNYIIAYWG